jgi:hypothetical protein
MTWLGTVWSGFESRPGGKLPHSLARGRHLIMGRGVDATRPVQPLQRGAQVLAEAVHASQVLAELGLLHMFVLGTDKRSD